MTTDYTQERLTIEDMRRKLLEQAAELADAHALLDGYCIPAGTLPQRIIRLRNNGIDMVNWGIEQKREAHAARAALERRKPRRKAA